MVFPGIDEYVNTHEKVVSVPRNGKLLESQESKIYFFNTNSIKNMIIRMGTWVVISQTRVSLMRYTVSECIRNSASRLKKTI